MYTMVMVNEDKMTLKQAMNFLGIKSPKTIRKYADSGELPCVKLPSPAGEWRIFRKKDLVVFKQKMLKEPVNGLSYIPFSSRKKRGPKPK